MDEDSCMKWEEAETRLVEAVHRLRMAYNIRGTTPPPPSLFNYSKSHKSAAISGKMSKLARDWFAIWMGLLSYILAQASLPENYKTPSMPQDKNCPYPSWYMKLEKDPKISLAWLDGLSTLTVNTFDTKTPHAGVVLRWTKTDKLRPSIDFFLDHHIPVYYPWTIAEEEAVHCDSSLRHLQLPEQMVKQALDAIFQDRDFASGTLIMNSYLWWKESPQDISMHLLDIKYARSFVFQYVSRKFMHKANHGNRPFQDPLLAQDKLELLIAERTSKEEEAARVASNLPMRNMIGWLNEEEKGALYHIGQLHCSE
ncbi:hypothetical protein CVT25_008025 [Psilocybe cyanescens]|uniref:Uncharacterized protein n=1 Tax=Psilocybe cyanescens TaxID=93625 RepID=A0A409XTX9_PSICY|nr:hypothetical protein CVT25_008025 [Psilocybe cyanescens]